MSEKTRAEELFDLGDEQSTAGAKELHEGNTEEGYECFRQAISAYGAALKEAPKDDLYLRMNLLLCIGAREFGIGQVEEALARYDEVIATLGSETEGEGAELLAQARLNRADYLMAAGKVEEARNVVDAVLLQYPEHGYAGYLKTRCIAGG